MPTGYELLGNDVRSRWIIQQSQWDASIASIPVVFDNYDDDDTGVAAARRQRQPWMRVAIETGEEKQAAFGNQSLWRSVGSLDAYVYVPIGDGPALGDSISDVILADWRGITLRRTLFRKIRREKYDSPDGKWCLLLCSIEFQRDDLFARGEARTEGEVAITHTVTTVAPHGFSARDWVTPITGTWTLAIADGTQSLHTVLPVVEVISTTQFKVATGGSVTFFNHGWNTGDRTIYVSQSTAGDVTNTLPAAGWVKQVGVALDDDSIDVEDLNPWFV